MEEHPQTQSQSHEFDDAVDDDGNENYGKLKLKEEVEDSSQSDTEMKLNAQFSSFISLRAAIEKYQRENHVQLIVKDSKLLSSESTKKIIPKVYHLVNQKLMYHSITYCCKCHGELKQKPGSRVKNIGSKRLSCPMYMRFRLTTDLQSLVLFDLLETHNHNTDCNTFLMSPRQQVYRLSAICRGKPDPGDVKRRKNVDAKKSNEDVETHNFTTNDENSVSKELNDESEPPEKVARISGHKGHEPLTEGQTRKDNGSDESSENDEEFKDEEDGNIQYMDNPYTALDPDSSCSDSDEEEFRRHRDILPLPIRLIGSAVQSSPELIALTKELITTQLETLKAKNTKIQLENKMLELKNEKLALELNNLEKSLSATVPDQGTTFYLQS